MYVYTHIYNTIGAFGNFDLIGIYLQLHDTRIQLQPFLNVIISLLIVLIRPTYLSVRKCRPILNNGKSLMFIRKITDSQFMLMIGSILKGLAYTV